MIKFQILILNCAILMLSVSKCKCEINFTETFRYLVDDIEPEDVELTVVKDAPEETTVRLEPETTIAAEVTEIPADLEFIDKRILDSEDAQKRCPKGKIRDRKGICRIVFRYRRATLS